jgi:hypothetical protein
MADFHHHQPQSPECVNPNPWLDAHRQHNTRYTDLTPSDINGGADPYIKFHTGSLAVYS